MAEPRPATRPARKHTREDTPAAVEQNPSFVARRYNPAPPTAARPTAAMRSPSAAPPRHRGARARHRGACARHRGACARHRGARARHVGARARHRGACARQLHGENLSAARQTKLPPTPIVGLPSAPYDVVHAPLRFLAVLVACARSRCARWMLDRNHRGRRARRCGRRRDGHGPADVPHPTGPLR